MVDVKDETDVGEPIRKNTREVIRVRLATFNGIRCLDCRTYFEREPGDFQPSKKGFACSPTLIPVLIERLEEAWKVWQSESEQAQPKE